MTSTGSAGPATHCQRRTPCPQDALDAAGAAPPEHVPDTAHLHPVYVTPAHRGQDGPARALVEAATDFARRHTECGRLTLGVHEDNHPRHDLLPTHRIPRSWSDGPLSAGPYMRCTDRECRSGGIPRAA
ncbi:GNAT family N-acetyltransferase [Streptomyces sp. rh34]|uniref:GNAT family N-acetyltransferase n=1 Tax=Streptomyces sp. rh34 TaxID=2034272 RepID=UPI000BEF5BF4